MGLVDVRSFSAKINETSGEERRRKVRLATTSAMKNAVSLFETHRCMNPERIDHTEPLDEVAGE